MDCLVSPTRVDLYEAIQKQGKASVAELAQILNKTVHSLYYHLRQLERVKLIRVAGYQRVGKKDEAVYETLSRRLTIDRDNTDPTYRESLIKAIRIMLRKAEREHREARESNLADESFGVLRVQASLSPDDAARLRQKLVDLGSWIRRRSNSDNQGETIAVTGLIVPLEELS